MPEKILDAGDAQFRIRDGTLDWENVEEYKTGHWRLCDFRPADRWLDAGANIGTFSVYAAKQCEYVVACEPEKDNYRMLLANLTLNDARNVNPLPFAVVGNGDRDRDFYLETHKNKGTHSLFKRASHFQKTTVQCADINALLEANRIDCIEMDVEGAEVELIHAIWNWEPIRQLYVEYHNYVLKDHDLSGLAEMMAFLRERFDSVEMDEANEHKLWKIIVAKKGPGQTEEAS